MQKVAKRSIEIIFHVAARLFYLLTKLNKNLVFEATAPKILSIRMSGGISCPARGEIFDEFQQTGFCVFRTVPW